MYPNQMYNPMFPNNKMFNPMYQQATNNLIPVRSEAEALSYPMEAGTSLTFKNETAPYLYTKTMGPSPLDQPKFEKYKIVKEGGESDNPIKTDYVTMDDLKAVISDVESLKDEIYGLKRKPATKRKEVVEDDT